MILHGAVNLVVPAIWMKRYGNPLTRNLRIDGMSQPRRGEQSQNWWAMMSFTPANYSC